MNEPSVIYSNQFDGDYYETEINSYLNLIVQTDQQCMNCTVKYTRMGLEEELKKAEPGMVTDHLKLGLKYFSEIQNSGTHLSKG